MESERQIQIQAEAFKAPGKGVNPSLLTQLGVEY